MSARPTSTPATAPGAATGCAAIRRTASRTRARCDRLRLRSLSDRALPPDDRIDDHRAVLVLRSERERARARELFHERVRVAVQVAAVEAYRGQQAVEDLEPERTGDRQHLALERVGGDRPRDELDRDRLRSREE